MEYNRHKLKLKVWLLRVYCVRVLCVVCLLCVCCVCVCCAFVMHPGLTCLFFDLPAHPPAPLHVLIRCTRMRILSSTATPMSCASPPALALWSAHTISSTRASW